MQYSFKTALTVKEYAAKGIKQDIPKPRNCLQCKSSKLYGHGWCWRYCLDGLNSWLIPVRRYYCPHCGITFSMLPIFCLPGIQYSLKVVLQCIWLRIAKEYSLRRVRRKLTKRFPQLAMWSLSQVDIYPNLFLKHLSRFELVLRQLQPRCRLPDSGMGIKKRAKKVLDLIPHGFDSLERFAGHYQRICQSSFLAPYRTLYYHDVG